jgi:hypothetical protein
MSGGSGIVASNHIPKRDRLCMNLHSRTASTSDSEFSMQNDESVEQERWNEIFDVACLC